MYSEPIFVKTFVKGVDRKGQLIINGLRAGKKYDIQCYTYNINEIVGKNSQKFSIKIQNP